MIFIDVSRKFHFYHSKYFLSGIFFYLIFNEIAQYPIYIIHILTTWKIQCKLPPKTKRFCPLKTFNNAPLKSLDRWGYYYFRFSTVWHNHLRNKHLTEHLRNNSNELATVRFSAFCGAMLSNNSFLMQR